LFTRKAASALDAWIILAEFSDLPSTRLSRARRNALEADALVKRGDDGPGLADVLRFSDLFGILTAGFWNAVDRPKECWMRFEHGDAA